MTDGRRAVLPLGDVARYLAFAAIYVIAAKTGFRAALMAEQVSPVWPPTGLALWVLVVLGIRAWPGVWIGALVANLTTDVPPVQASLIAVGNTLEAVIGAWGLRRFVRVERTIDTLRQVVTFLVVAAGVSTMVSATIGVTTLATFGMQSWDRFGTLWWTWFLGDATGDLIVGALLLTAPAWRRVNGRPAGTIEPVAVGLVAVGLSVIVFSVGPRPPTPYLRLDYLIFPLVMWAGLRFAHPGAAAVSAIVSVVAVWGTLQGTGPFSDGSGIVRHEHVVLLQLYAAVIATTGLVFGAAIADRNHAERLRQTVHQLTAVLSQEPDLFAAARRIVNAVGETLDWDLGLVWRVDDRARQMEFVESWQRDSRADAFVADSRHRTFERGVGLPGRVWTAAHPAWIADVVQDPAFQRAAVALRSGIRSGFAFPIMAGPTVLGVVEVFSFSARPADASMLALMADAGAHVGQFIERAQAQQRVKESEALTTAIIDAALDCIISIDADGTVLEFNAAAVRTFGISRADAIGRELAELIVPPELQQRHREGLRRNAETGQSQILGQRLEMPARRADGSSFTVELAVTRVVGGRRPVFTAHLRDITDRRRIEQERTELLERERRARLEAEDANRSKDQFLATVSHELRTPLTAILGWSAMLQSQQFDQERIPQIHDKIFRNAQAQAQIVNDLLDVSRIVTGQIRLDWQSTDIGEVARASLETIRPTALAKGVALVSEIEDAPCLVSGDPARLQQVVWNLLSNAVKFTPAGGRVMLRVQQTAVAATIEVIDTGMGISNAHLPRLFERFWQADSTSTRTFGGLGLGLALVRHLVEVHGGAVDASSAGEGHGSTFTVSLPVQPAVGLATPPMVGAASAVPPGDRQDLAGFTMLIVDDDAAARELFADIFQRIGARVLIAGSAADAISAITDHAVDLFVLDIGMPGEDGMMLLQRIRAHEDATRLPHAPAIAVTAYATAADRENVLRAGFVAHVPKPVLPDEVLAVVRQTLAARRL